VNKVKEGGFSPLMIASHQGQVECVKILLSAGDDALHKADKGATALDLAIHFKVLRS
jgi:ankyrin repeat protein